MLVTWCHSRIPRDPGQGRERDKEEKWPCISQNKEGKEGKTNYNCACIILCNVTTNKELMLHKNSNLSDLIAWQWQWQYVPCDDVILVACVQVGSMANNRGGQGHGDNISSSLGHQLSHHRITATWATFCQQLILGGHQQKKTFVKTFDHWKISTSSDHRTISDCWRMISDDCNAMWKKQNSKEEVNVWSPVLFVRTSGVQSLVMLGFILAAKQLYAWKFDRSRERSEERREDMNNKTNLRGSRIKQHHPAKHKTR